MTGRLGPSGETEAALTIPLKQKLIYGILGGLAFHRLVPNANQRQSIYGGLWLCLTLWALFKLAIAAVLFALPVALVFLAGGGLVAVVACAVLLGLWCWAGARLARAILLVYRATHALWPLAMGTLLQPVVVHRSLTNRPWLALPAATCLLVLCAVLLPIGLLAFACGATA
jgi:hypothetical protein